MNIQAMMKQAQKLLNDMLKEKSQIDEKIFEGKSSFVTVKVKGTKEVVEIKIDAENLEKDLTFIGFVGMIDPCRPEVYDAIKEC